MGAYDEPYRSNRAVLLAAWNADPETRCWLCGLRALVEDPWEPDHVLPVAEGGDHIANLRASHRSCNRARGAKLAAQRKRQAIEARAAARIRETELYLTR